MYLKRRPCSQKEVGNIIDESGRGGDSYCVSPACSGRGEVRIFKHRCDKCEQLGGCDLCGHREPRQVQTAGFILTTQWLQTRSEPKHYMKFNKDELQWLMD